MRELKFRIWNNTDKEMYFSKPLKFRNLGYMDLEDSGNGLYGLMGHALTTSKGIDTNKKEVIIQQFTGLYDKNKKPIYEGDIVNVQRSFTRPYVKDGKIDYKTIDGGLEVGQVIWWEMKAAFLIAYKGDDMDDFRYLSYSYEVIGNIFESKELLKNKNEQ